MNGSTKKQLFLWVNQSNGDTLATIPIVENLLNKYQDLDIVFGCWEHHSYLLQHFPIKLMPFKYNLDLGRSLRFDLYTPDFYTPISLWLGNYPNEIGTNFFWKNCILNFNNQCRDKKVDLSLEYDLPGFINLPNVDVNVNSNSIMVENGLPDTNPNYFFFDINAIADQNPKLTFYCMGKTNSNLPNVVDLSIYNLIVIQNVLKKCKMFIGRGSGPCFLTAHEMCKDMIKGLFGFDYKSNGKIWNPDDTNWHYNEANTESILRFIEEHFTYE